MLGRGARLGNKLAMQDFADEMIGQIEQVLVFSHAFSGAAHNTNSKVFERREAS
jgi:hypothetical protein